MNDARNPTTVMGSFPVLVIDDNEADRKLMAIQLGQAWPFVRDLLVEEAASGQEALDKLRDRRFALIVLDWKMPGISGFDVLHHMRKNGVRIPVVVVSGLERVDIPADLESLAASFLNKDQMTTENLHEAIAQSLRLLGSARSSTAG